MTTSEKPSCPKCGKPNMRRNGICPRTKKQQWLCTGGADETYCYSTTDPSAPYRDSRKRARRQEDAQPRKKFKKKLSGKRFIITSAQNATPLHENFWAALQRLAADVGAEIAVIPLRYKNATSVWTESQRNEEFWEVPNEYLFEQRKKLNDNLVVVGDVKIQPTADDPLTGLEGMSRGESAIFGHTKLRLKCNPTSQDRMAKVLTTTGACTVKNYTDSKAGKKGEFHHVLGAVLVEIESRSKFHLHHINARLDGAFIYDRTAYYPTHQEPAGQYQALVFGDAHWRFADPRVVDATFGGGKEKRDGLVQRLDPQVLVWHDLLDAYFGNPHHHDPFTKLAKGRAGFHVAESEVFSTIDWMRELGAGRENVVVSSNHDDMFKRWIVREDWKELDADNMEFYLKTALHMARSARMTEIGASVKDPFIYWLEQRVGPNDRITCVGPTDGYRVGGINLAYHGDRGPKGARGTTKNLAKIGEKLITGHCHSPEIYQGHWRTGTMTRLTAEYVDGPNDWLNAHISVDAFGKRHLHICVDGKFFMGD